MQRLARNSLAIAIALAATSPAVLAQQKINGAPDVPRSPLAETGVPIAPAESVSCVSQVINGVPSQFCTVTAGTSNSAGDGGAGRREVGHLADRHAVRVRRPRPEQGRAEEPVLHVVGVQEDRGGGEEGQDRGPSRQQGAQREGAGRRGGPQPRHGRGGVGQQREWQEQQQQGFLGLHS